MAEAREIHGPDGAQIEEALNRILLEGLHSVAVGLILIFTAFGVFDSYAIPAIAVLPIVAWDIATILLGATIRAALCRNWIDARYAHGVALLIGAVVLGNILSSFYLVRSPLYIPLAVVLIVCSGSIVLSVPWFAGAISAMALATVAVASITPSAFSALDAGLAVFAATVLSAVIFSARRQAFIRIELLRLRDEAQRRDLEAALRDREQQLAERDRAEARLREIVEGVDAIVWEADPATLTFTFINDHVEKVLGYPKQTWLERPRFWVDCLHPEDRDSTVDACQTKTLAGENHELEYRAVAADGRVVWLRDIVRVVKNADGAVVQIRGIMIDITARIASEEETTRLESHLRQAQKMEAIGTLAGGVAHDFNNLLAGILGYGDILLQDPDATPRQRKAAQIIYKAAERAAQLTKQLLGFARKGKLQIVPVELNEVIQEVVTLLGRTIDKKISIERKAGARRCLVLGDPDQIQQIILNLAVNARDAMPEGGKLSFRVEPVELDDAYCAAHTHARPGRYILLEVQDTGGGIPRDVLPRIFEPFFTTKGQGKGTGMGLAMVYGIVKNHGGSIEVYSEPDVGTTFRVYLPVAGDGAALSVGSTQPMAAMNGKGKILLVDDEEVVREMASDMLRTMGYEVVLAADGQEAIEVYRKLVDEVDLVIMDMIMPRVDGRECFRGLKKINPAVKAILSTGFGCDGAAQEILDEGMLGFTPKPFRMRELAESVAFAMKQSGEGKGA